MWEDIRVFDDIVNPGEVLSPFLVFYLFAFGLSAVVGSIGNTLVIITVLYDRKLRKSKNCFILSLAVADFWVSAVTMPASIWGVILGRHWFDEHYLVCRFTAGICTPACLVSVYSMAWIAAHRYYYIGDYGYCVEHFTTSRIFIYVIVTWLFGISVHVPNYIGWGQIRYSFILRFCGFDSDTPSYGPVYASLLILALIVTFIFYVHIYRLIKSSSLAQKMITGQKRRLSNKRLNNTTSTSHVSSSYLSLTTKLPSSRLAADPHNAVNALIHDFSRLSRETKVIAISFRKYLFFLISWAPVTVLCLLLPGHAVPPWFYLLCALLAHCNSTLNFMLYFWMDGPFRVSLYQMTRRFFSMVRKQSSASDCMMGSGSG